MSALLTTDFDEITNIPAHLVLSANLQENDVWDPSKFQSVLDIALQFGINKLTIAVVISQRAVHTIKRNRDHFDDLYGYLETNRKNLAELGISSSVFDQEDSYDGRKLQVTAADTTKLQLNLLYDQNGRKEIVAALQQLQIQERSPVNLRPMIENYFKAHPLADPDLIIVTGGERRLMNLLTWQASYSEFMFIETPWVEIKDATLIEILKDFQTHQRRFGKG